VSKAELVIVALLVFIFAREVFFLLTTHRLINKIMSANYRDFQLSSQTGRMKNEVKKEKFELEEEEDLGALSGLI
jgi:hypothetical protein